MIIAAPGERHVLAHRQSKAARDRTRCGQLVTDDWEGLHEVLSTPMCARCEDGDPTCPPRAASAAQDSTVGSSAYRMTQQIPPTPHKPVQPAEHTREAVRSGDRFTSLWRLLAQLLDRT